MAGWLDETERPTDPSSSSSPSYFAHFCVLRVSHTLLMEISAHWELWGSTVEWGQKRRASVRFHNNASIRKGHEIPRYLRTYDRTTYILIPNGTPNENENAFFPVWKIKVMPRGTMAKGGRSCCCFDSLGFNSGKTERVFDVVCRPASFVVVTRN